MAFPNKSNTHGRSPEKSGRARHKHTRMSSAWVSLVLAAVILVLLLIFILENSGRVDIAYFGAHGHLPLGVALLFAAVLGILLVAVPGTGRILQLRKAARRGAKAATQAEPDDSRAGQVTSSDGRADRRTTR
jgi:uncharacterized integral membrane protein